MKIQIHWPLISGYMAACWRELARHVELLEIIAWRPDSGSDNVAFDDATVAGLNIRLLDARERRDAALPARLFREGRPDAVLVPGWFHAPYRQVANEAAAAGVPVLMCMDSNLRFSLRQLIGRYWYARWFRHIDAVLVAGERSAHLARWLGFDTGRIHTGAYGFDFTGFSAAAAQRAAINNWPRRFAFIGRYVERKGLDTLVSAYQRYRRMSRDPWQLDCYGQGPLASLLHGMEGITDHGFRQPAELPELLASAGAFILPSRFEAWGVALAEAAASGLPLVASSEVGSVPELLRDGYNGRIFACDDAGALAEALLWIESRDADCAELGRRSQTLAEPFRAEQWATRVQLLVEQLAREKSGRKHDA
jgi:hypothetical protein